MKINKYPKILGLILSVGAVTIASTNIISSCGQNPTPKPSRRQMAWHKLEQYAFVHFGLNTYTNREWGWGDEPPIMFNPTNYDPEQWVKTFKDAGLTQLVLTCKHHDGFCLWPTSYTERSVKSATNFQSGKGDVVKDVSDACRKFGLKFGIYLSPWDRSRDDYGTPSYVSYYKNELRELLTNYGEISEVWFDGAQGGTGWYGGVDGEPTGLLPDGRPDPDFDPNNYSNLPSRHVDNQTYYDWSNIYRMVRQLQPNAIMNQGPDCRWCGNEEGYAGDPNWNTINVNYPKAHDMPQQQLNNGDENGFYWIPSEVDVSSRPGWFWHANEDSKVKTGAELFDIYLKSVGRGSNLILNIPPNQEGLIDDTDISALEQWKAVRDDAFFECLGKSTNSLQLDFIRPRILTYVLIQENIAYGQRVKKFDIDYWDGNTWQSLSTSYQTIGYKRIVQLEEPITTTKMRIRITATRYNLHPYISNLEAY